MSRLTVSAIAFVVGFCMLSGPLHGNPLEAADKLVLMKRYHEAIEKINEVLKVEPNHPTALAILGKAQFHLSRMKAATATFEKIIRIDPERYKNWSAPFLARLAFWHGDDDKARKYLADTLDDQFTAHGLPPLLEAKGMKRKNSKHYIVYVDANLAGRKADVYASKLMELIHGYYSKVFRFPREPIYSRVYLFSKKEDYQEFEAQIYTAAQLSDSFYSHSYRVLLINADPQGAKTNEFGFSTKTISAMFLTGFNQFMHMHAPTTPRWFTDGMAEYFGQGKLQGKKIQLGHIVKVDPRGGGHTSRYQRVKRSIKDGAFLPLTTLLTMSDNDFGDPTNGRFITNAAQAWSFVHFLLHSKALKKKGKKLIVRYFMVIHGGSTREEAYAQTFGTLNLKKLEAQWQEYIRSF